MNMRKILLFTVLLFFTNITLSQVTTTGNSTDWNSASAWSSGSVPDSSTAVQIDDPITISADADCSTLTVTTQGSLNDVLLTIDNNATLTIHGSSGTALTNNDFIQVGTGSSKGKLVVSSANVTNNGKLDVAAGSTVSLGSTATLTNAGPISINSNVSSYGSFVMAGDYTTSGIFHSFEYGRHINGVSNGWDLVGSPLDGVSISSFISSNGDVASQTVSGTVWHAVGTYTNTTAAYSSGQGWTNYNENTVGSAGNFITAKGYQMAGPGTSGAKVEFSGTPLTADQTITVTNNEAGGEGDQNSANGTKFNIVANPFPGFITGRFY